MATRRVRPTVASKYVQPLKLRMHNKAVVTLGVDYNSILFTKNHQKGDWRKPDIVLFAKFNSTAFQGINFLASISAEDDFIFSLASCTFKIYSVKPETNWVPVLLHTVNGTQSQKRWTATLTQSDIGATEVDGDNVFLIEALLVKWNTTFKKRVYLNHLGIFDNLTRLKQTSDLLLVTKLDD
jgi:hypothetical protein